MAVKPDLRAQTPGRGGYGEINHIVGVCAESVSVALCRRADRSGIRTAKGKRYGLERVVYPLCVKRVVARVCIATVIDPHRVSAGHRNQNRIHLNGETTAISRTGGVDIDSTGIEKPYFRAQAAACGGHGKVENVTGVGVKGVGVDLGRGTDRAAHRLSYGKSGGPCPGAQAQHHAPDNKQVPIQTFHLDPSVRGEVGGNSTGPRAGAFWFVVAAPRSGEWHAGGGSGRKGKRTHRSRVGGDGRKLWHGDPPHCEIEFGIRVAGHF